MATKSNKTAAKTGFSAKPQPQPESPPAAATAPTADDSAALNATIATLESKLASAVQHETKLNATIAALERKLAEQSDQIQTLQSQANAAAKVQADLDKAKAEARQLATLNQKLMTEAEAAQATIAQATATAKAAKAAEAKAAAEEKAAAEAKAATALAAPKQPNYNNLVHPVFPNGSLPSGIEDKEIGWFD
jgi:colicin import membrane protein